MKTKFRKTLCVAVLGGCLAFSSVNAVWAAPVSSIEPVIASSSSQVIMEVPSGYESEALWKKHQEIDQYVFESHAGEIEGRGFQVTHTGPVDGKIEIGITPYSESHAQFLYKTFGEEFVKVVEGTLATPLMAPADGIVEEGTMEIQTLSASPQSVEPTSKSTSPSPYILWSGGGILGIALLWLGRWFVVSKKK